MTRVDIINYIISAHNLDSYLEIGVSNGDSLDGCRARVKLGVDPSGNYKGSTPVLRITSDEFFDSLNSTTKFDLIFIDGLHTAAQVKKDIMYALNHVYLHGFIVVHDCNPPTEYHARSFEDFIKTGGDWNGTVYKGYIEAVHSTGVNYFTVDTDWGVGIIRPKSEYPSIIEYPVIDWNIFDKNRKRLLNLIDEKDLRNYI